MKNAAKIVFVLNQDGTPLMPCRPQKARRLLDEGKARVARRNPFTIRLNWQCEAHVQPVTVGIDKGSHTTGFTAVGNGRVLLSGHIHHRRDVKLMMDGRRDHRRARRNRKWYRPCRFLNRASSRRSGRLPSSVQANVEEVYRVVRKLPLPISRLIIEDVQIDIARLNDPELNGRHYQQTNRLHPNLRLACLIRDDFTCRICKKKGCRLEAHHIIPRHPDGGKDTIKNLATLCEPCHKKLHQGKVTLNLVGENGFKDRMAQRSMQGKTHLYGLLGGIAPVEKVFGYQTQDYRKALGLDKDHDVDALCVATLLDGESVPYDRHNFYAVSFLPRQTRRQFHSLPRKGKGRVRYQVNKELDGFCKGDVVRVKGRWEKRVLAICSDGRLAFPRVPCEPPSCVPRRCRLLERAKTVLFQQSNYAHAKRKLGELIHRRGNVLRPPSKKTRNQTMSNTMNVNQLLQSAVDDGLLSMQAQNALVSPDIGATIQQGLGTGSPDEIKASELLLVYFCVDDSSSMNYVSDHNNPGQRTNCQLAAEGHNVVLAALADTKQRDGIRWCTALLNKGVIARFDAVDKALQLNDHNYRAQGCTPLDHAMLSGLGTVFTEARVYEQAMIPVRTFTVFVGDGAPYVPSGDPRGKTRPQDVADMFESMQRNEGQHIVFGFGIQDGSTDFRAAYRERGLPDKWIFEVPNDPHAIRQMFGMVSQSAVRASQGAVGFSQTAQGGLGGFGS